MIENEPQPLAPIISLEEQDKEVEEKSEISSPGDPGEESAKTLAQIIVSQIQSLKDYHTNVLEACEEDAVHKMRVTTRRLQASLDLLQFGKQKAKIKKLKQRLRKWRRQLSIIRNYDVFLLLLESEAEKQKTTKKSLEAIKAELQDRRERLAKEVLEYLKQVSVDKVAQSLRLPVGIVDKEVEKEKGATTADVEADGNGQNQRPKQPDPAHASLSHIAAEKDIAKRAAQRIEQRLNEFLALASQAKPTTHPEELHQLRIAAKRLRYLLEIAADLGYGNSLTALNWLRSLQDRIGDWHDLESLEDEILGIVANQEFMKERLAECVVILSATVHLQSKRKALISRLFPVKVHIRVASSSKRVAQAFLRSASTKTST